MPTKKAAPKAVHRSLHLTSPLAKGADVKALQEAIKKGLAHYKVDWLPLSVDGALGRQTIHAATFYAWILGVPNSTRRKLKAGTIPEGIQVVLRDPRKRGRSYRARADLRQEQLARIRKAQSEGPAFAVAGARACVGITENPAGSNSGPDHTIVVQRKKFTVGVSAFERYWGLGPCYWCLCFACFWVKQAGGKISGNCAYSVAIEGYARNHENGWVQVPIDKARPGDIAIWKFEGPSAPSDHGELVTEVEGGHVGVPIEDTGGNTGPDSGSQSNGGGVFAKPVPGSSRDLSMLSMVARPLYS